MSYIPAVAVVACTSQLSAMEKAWIELGAAQTLPAEQIFYQGWVSRGFFELDQIHARAAEALNETDADKTD